MRLAAPTEIGGGVRRRLRLVRATRQDGAAEGKQFRWWPPAIIGGITALAAQSWFAAGTLIVSGDNLPIGLLRPEDTLEAMRWAWGSGVTPTGGFEHASSLQAVPAFLGKALGLVGADPHLRQRLFLTLLFVGMALAMYLLLRTLLPERRQIGGVMVGSLFYAFNPALFFVIPNSVLMANLILLALIPALIIRGSRETGWRYPVLFAAASLLGSYAFVNPPSFALVLVGGSVAVIGSLIWGDRRRTGAFLWRAVPLAAMVNLWWAVPTVLGLLDGSGRVIPGADALSWSWTHERSSITNVLRMTPVWSWPRPEYYPYASSLQSQPLSALMFVPAVLVFAAPLLLRGRRRLVAIAVAASAAVVVFLAKGLHTPLSGVNEALYEHVPGMWLFREPAAKFTLVLALVLGVGLALLLASIPRPRWRHAAAAGMGAVILAVGFPIWSGAVIPEDRPGLPPARTAIPPYWEDAAAFLNDRPGRTLVLPADDYYQVPYEWGFYGADLIADELVGSPVIKLLEPEGNLYVAPEPGVQAMLDALTGAVRAGDAQAVARLSRSLGVRWVLLRRDVDSSFPGRDIQDPDELRGILSGSADLHPVATFGELDLFELRDQRPGVRAVAGVMEAPATSLVHALALPPVGTEALVAKGSLSDLLPSREVVLGSGEEPVEGHVPYIRWPDGMPVRAELVPGTSGHLEVVFVPEISSDGAGSAPLVGAALPSGSTETWALSLDGRIVPGGATAGPLEGSGTTLVPGIHRLDVLAPQGAQLLEDPSFERGTWGPVQDCDANDPRSPSEVGLAAQRVAEGPSGRFALSLSASGHAACAVREVSGFDPGAVYRVSLHHLHRSGAPPRMCLWQEGLGRCAPIPPLDAEPGWHHYEQLFKPEAGTTGLTLHLYADGRSEGTTALYDGVRVEALLPSTSESFAVPWGWIGPGSTGAVDPERTELPHGGPSPVSLEDPSFERGTWGPVQDCDANDPRSPSEVGLAAQRVAEGPSGRFALSLSASGHAACAVREVSGFDPGAVYRVSLHHLHRSGAPPRMCLWQEGLGRCAPIPPLDPEPGWHHYEQLFKPEPGATGLTLHLYADGRPQGTNVLYDGVRVEAVQPRPEVALVEEGEIPGAVPEISLRRIDPTEYRVEVRSAKDPFLLVTNETFHEGWELEGAGPVVHTKVDGYANGWLVEREGTYSASLQFRPQAMVDWARIASGLTALVILLVAATLAVRRGLRPRSPS